jgi:hypothetical protein
MPYYFTEIFGRNERNGTRTFSFLNYRVFGGFEAGPWAAPPA